jgi:hypothetical protein
MIWTNQKLAAQLGSVFYAMHLVTGILIVPLSVQAAHLREDGVREVEEVEDAGETMCRTMFYVVICGELCFML